MLQEELHAIAALCCLFKSESFIILIFLSFCFVFFLNFFKNNNEWLKYFDSKYFNSKVGISLTKSEKSNSSYFWGGKLSAPHIIDLLTPRCMVFFSVRKRNYTHFHQFIWMSMLFISEKTQIIIIIIRCGSAAMALLLLTIILLSSATNLHTKENGEKNKFIECNDHCWVIDCFRWSNV